MIIIPPQMPAVLVGPIKSSIALENQVIVILSGDHVNIAVGDLPSLLLKATIAQLGGPATVL